jgi:hypothetical protein
VLPFPPCCPLSSSLLFLTYVSPSSFCLLLLLSLPLPLSRSPAPLCHHQLNVCMAWIENKLTTFFYSLRFPTKVSLQSTACIQEEVRDVCPGIPLIPLSPLRGVRASLPLRPACLFCLPSYRICLLINLYVPHSVPSPSFHRPSPPPPFLLFHPSLPLLFFLPLIFFSFLSLSLSLSLSSSLPDASSGPYTETTQWPRTFQGFVWPLPPQNYTHTCKYMYTHTHIHTHTHTRNNIYVHIYMYIHVCM